MYAKEIEVSFIPKVMNPNCYLPKCTIKCNLLPNQYLHIKIRRFQILTTKKINLDLEWGDFDINITVVKCDTIIMPKLLEECKNKEIKAENITIQQVDLGPNQQQSNDAQGLINENPKGESIACTRCTFINNPGASQCVLCYNSLI